MKTALADVTLALAARGGPQLEVETGQRLGALRPVRGPLARRFRTGHRPDRKNR